MGVKWFDSTITAAPKMMSSNPGELLAILDACLVNGFGSKPVTQLTINNGMATAQMAGGHTFVPDLVVRIAGVTAPAGLNGEHRVAGANVATVSFPVDLPNGTATGEIVIDIAPAGWVKVAGTNQAAYRSGDSGATGAWLFVDDSKPSDNNNAFASVVGYEDLTDLSIKSRPFPTSGAVYFPRRSAASGAVTTSVPWSLFADERYFIFAASVVNTQVQHDPRYHSVVGFGDIKALRAGDPYCAMVTGMNAYNDAWGSVGGGMLHLSNNGTGGHIARAYHGIGGGVPGRLVASSRFGDFGAVMSGYNAGLGPYPNPVDNGLVLTPMAVVETANNALRGTIPGVLFIAQHVNGALANGSIVDGAGPFAGRRLRIVGVGNPNSGAQHGALAVDITGPWR